ncbi:MAG: histidine phosphatase family protein [Legionellales bacterium]|nr:histidine phosphatase family protein [Legionellales bacterium]
MKIIYIVHSTSNDNEISIASGKYDVSLSTRGISQAKELHSYFSREKHNQWGSIFSSTLIRAIDTANLVFPEMQNTIIKDARLNEIDYGIYTGKNKQEVDKLKQQYIYKCFPDGESYSDVEKRVRDFLEQYKHKEIITLISHQAPQLALEVICNQQSWQSAMDLDWRNSNPKKWQCFWTYYYS